MTHVISKEQFKHEYNVTEYEKEKNNKKIIFITVNLLLLFSMFLYGVNYTVMKYYIETDGSIYVYIALRTILSIPIMLFMYGAEKGCPSKKKLLQRSDSSIEGERKLTKGETKYTKKDQRFYYNKDGDIHEKEKLKEITSEQKEKLEHELRIKIQNNNTKKKNYNARRNGNEKSNDQEETNMEKEKLKKNIEENDPITWKTLIRGDSSEDKLIPTKAYGPLIIVSAAAAVRQLIVLTALQFTDSHNVGVIQPSVPVCTSIMSYYLKIEKLDAFAIISILFTFIGLGIACEIWNIHSLDLGFFLLLLVPVSKGLQVIYISIASKYISNNIIQYCQIVGLVLLTLPYGIIGEMLVYKQYNIFSSIWNLTFIQFSCILYSTIAIIYLCWKIQIFALNTLTPVAVALYQSVQPCFSFALSKIFLNETITIHKYIGTLFICTALFLYQYRNYKKCTR